MTRSSFKSSIIADLKFISHDKSLLVCCLIPFIIILLMTYVFPLLSRIIFSGTGSEPENYYSLAAVSLVSVIPMVFGIVYASILLSEKDLRYKGTVPLKREERKNILYGRMMISAIISFVFVLLSVILLKPVPTEGWLRNLFAALLLSIQAPFVLLFIVALTGKSLSRTMLSWLYGIFLIAVPLGLMLYHPWNYFAFFSPLYWVAWSWIVRSQVESLIYGSIAVILTSGTIILCFRHFLGKMQADPVY